jgi:hypothetical protein
VKDHEVRSLIRGAINEIHHEINRRLSRPPDDFKAIGLCGHCGGLVRAGSIPFNTNDYYALPSPPRCHRCGAEAIPTLAMKDRRATSRPEGA